VGGSNLEEMSEGLGETSWKSNYSNLLSFKKVIDLIGLK
jgi:hypothetical protein